MLFWIFVACLVIGIGLLIWYCCSWKASELLNDLAAAFTIPGAICTAISLIIMIFTLGCKNVDAVMLEQEYNSLVYQYENNIYENDNDLGKRDLMLDIQEWNEKIAKNKLLQDNFWVGIYVPDIYDQFELIDLKPTS